jgi:hypothetical protein
MCTSSRASRRTLRQEGFTALELLLGMVLSVFLAMSIAPVVFSLQKTGVVESDRAVVLLQGRVAAARLERDLRMAGVGYRLPAEGPVLKASDKEVVFLSHSGANNDPCVTEWEIVGSNLMRRWGPSPSSLPTVFIHSLYVDNKTMLEGLSGDAHFSFMIDGQVVEGTVRQSDLGWIEAVVLSASGQDAAGEWCAALWTIARVGR